MINRITYQIKDLPADLTREAVIAHLEAQPTYGELTLRACASTGTMSLTVPRVYTFQYNDYFIEVIPLNAQLYITCYKITPGVLTEKYRQVREKISALNIYLDDFEKELRLLEYRTRHGARLQAKEELNALKREIKKELSALGINSPALKELLRIK
jgi:hypothetical protein